MFQDKILPIEDSQYSDNLRDDSEKDLRGENNNDMDKKDRDSLEDKKG